MCAGGTTITFTSTCDYSSIPVHAGGAATTVKQVYGFILSIKQALLFNYKRGRWRGYRIVFTHAVGITFAFASTCYFSAVPVWAGGIIITVAEACGVNLTITHALIYHCKEECWRGSCIVFAHTDGISKVFARTHNLSTISECAGDIVVAAAESCDFILIIAHTRPRRCSRHA